jgi:hypothetical protein
VRCPRPRTVTSVVNRYYDPTTGQFISVDPMVNTTGQSYSYTGNDPVNGTDPLGLCFLGGSWCNEIQNVVASNFDSFRHDTAAVADLPGYIIQGTGEAIYNAYVNIYQDGANGCSFFSLATQEDVAGAVFADEGAVFLGDGEGEVADILVKPVVENERLQNIVNDLYTGTTNPSRVGTGTTADAVRNELETGSPTGGSFHSIKATDYSNGLANLLKSGNLNSHDSLVAQSLLDDLQSSLGKGP